MAEVNDSKFGVQLQFAKTYHKITPRKKWACSWARGATQSLGVSFNIFVWAETSDFKFNTENGFAKFYYIITPKNKRLNLRPNFHRYLKIRWAVYKQQPHTHMMCVSIEHL